MAINNYTGIGNVAWYDTMSTSEGLKIFKLSLAINRQKEGADFIPVTAFGRLAETCEANVFKGQKVAVKGRLQSGQYDKNGETVRTIDVIADTIEFLEWSK